MPRVALDLMENVTASSGGSDKGNVPTVAAFPRLRTCNIIVFSLANQDCVRATHAADA
jgi:hypothetical protein